MPEPKPNPLLSHILGAVADRGAAELGKLELLHQVGREVASANEKLGRIAALLEELVERTK